MQSSWLFALLTSIALTLPLPHGFARSSCTQSNPFLVISPLSYPFFKIQVGTLIIALNGYCNEYVVID